ncbi:GAP family protein [Microbacterium limosum]|uniref:GAP family protein n=1 Tax=Microbacterium limosum TaxID=3079935 RepID=A0AAU0MJS4_9MICO|nr:GAP family protein [Microbacterium sp. Y20]WOQ70407.1 GAP family protein [Microbacterium sp. Y20]
MASVLWYILPLGVAMALSVLPLLAAVLILLRPDPLPVGVGYLAGWAIGVLVLVTVFTLAASLIPAGRGTSIPGWAHTVEIALGGALAVWGVWSIARARSAPPTAPSWTRALTSIGPRRAAAFGLAMNLRPKNLTLAVAAGLAIGSASLDIVDSGLAITVFTLIGVSTVAALVLSYLFGNRRVRPALERLSSWLLSHASTVLRVSLVVVGAALVAIGASNLVAS